MKFQQKHDVTFIKHFKKILEDRGGSLARISLKSRLNLNVRGRNLDIIRSNFVDQLAFNEILVLFPTHLQTIYSHPIDFRGANLAGAKLDDADLSGAYLRGTNIDLESQAQNVKFCKTVMPDREINNRDCEQ